MISVIVPTISGREESLARAIASYEETLRDVEHELIVVKDAKTWPTACNEGYARAQGNILHFSADDLEALPDWHVDAIYALGVRNELPAPKVYNFVAEESAWDNPEDGMDGELTHFTRIPLMTRAQYETIGSWPEIVYYADLWLSEKARTLGIRTRCLHSYRFIHHWSGIGRVDSRVNLDEAGFALNRLREQMV
jgi:hypothetical protein